MAAVAPARSISLLKGVVHRHCLCTYDKAYRLYFKGCNVLTGGFTQSIGVSPSCLERKTLLLDSFTEKTCTELGTLVDFGTFRHSISLVLYDPYRLYLVWACFEPSSFGSSQRKHYNSPPTWRKTPSKEARYGAPANGRVGNPSYASGSPKSLPLTGLISHDKTNITKSEGCFMQYSLSARRLRRAPQSI